MSGPHSSDVIAQPASNRTDGPRPQSRKNRSTPERVWMKLAFGMTHSLVQEADDTDDTAVVVERGDVRAASDRSAAVRGERPREPDVGAMAVRLATQAEIVAGELNAGGVNHRRDALPALTRHQWIDIAAIGAPGFGHEK